HPLVDHRLVGETRDVEHAALADVRGPYRGLDALADDVELALERQVVADGEAALDEQLTDLRLGGAGGAADHGTVGRHGAPAQKLLPLLLDNVDNDPLAVVLVVGVGRQKDQPGPVPARPRQADAALGDLLGEEPVRHLDEDAGAVAGVGLAAAGAAVLQVFQHPDRLPNDVVRRAALQIDDEADAAGVVLVAGVVQTLLSRGPRLRAGAGP